MLDLFCCGAPPELFFFLIFFSKRLDINKSWHQNSDGIVLRARKLDIVRATDISKVRHLSLARAGRCQGAGHPHGAGKGRPGQRKVADANVCLGFSWGLKSLLPLLFFILVFFFFFFFFFFFLNLLPLNLPFFLSFFFPPFQPSQGGGGVIGLGRGEFQPQLPFSESIGSELPVFQFWPPERLGRVCRQVIVPLVGCSGVSHLQEPDQRLGGVSGLSSS